MKFHVHPAQNRDECTPALTDFLKWVQDFLPADKYSQFVKLLSFPVPTVELTTEIFSQLRRALEGENGFMQFIFQDEDLEDDFADYKNRILKEDDVWKNEGFEAFKTAINNILIVDLPTVQLSDRPEPYFYFLEPELLFDIDINYKGNVEYIIFNEGDLTRYVFDDTFYRTYTRARIEDDFVLANEVQHSVFDENGQKISGLGYCPARLFWDVPLSKPEHFQRRGPITHVLSRLDKFVFWDVSTEYFEAFGTWPIYWEYINECDYTDNQGNSCEGGFIKSFASNGTQLDKRKCPKCEANKYIGPGSIKQVEAPADNQDADLREPVGIISVDVAALQNAQSRLAQRKESIFKAVVGAGGEPNNEQAKNEKQIKSGFETQHNVLIAIKQSFERARKWVLDTICILRYGENFVSSVVLLGDEFYLTNEEDLAESYRKDKESGMPVFHLSQSFDTLLQTKYKNNPDIIQRMAILAHLEPYPDKTIMEIADIAQKFAGTINPEDFLLKLNFDAYIKRFELEEMDVVRFGIHADFALKINSIKTKLLSYVNADREKASSSPRNDG